MSTSSASVFDVAIVGAGCAGLSLAVHLLHEARATPSLSVVLLDERTEWKRDRTWCFWNVLAHPFEAAVSRRWERWAVQHNNVRLERSVPGIPYVHVEAERFYSLALERVREVSHWSLRAGESVVSLEESSGDGPVRVRTSRGEILAKRVIDTRPPRFAQPVSKGEVRWFQHFVGWHVRCAPVLDPHVAMLMDFDVPQRPPVHFSYVLPYEANEALVEATWFSPAILPHEHYTNALENYLRSTLGLASWELVHEERGVLPMSTEAMHADPNAKIVRLGLSGGAARPSTGYAFLAIQRQCSAFAKALLRGVYAPCPPPHGPRVQVMDRVFLGYLARHPEQGAGQLFDLFQRLPPDLLVRFLSEASSLEDDWRVARSVPALRFSREVLTSLPSLAAKLRG